MEVTVTMDNLASTLQQKLSEALSSVVQQPVTLQLGHFGLVPLSEIQMMAGQSSVTAIYIPLLGDLIGDLFLFLDSVSSVVFADLMIGNEVGKTTAIGEFESSALKELGNICSGVIVTELANVLKLSIILTVPNLVTDFAQAVIDQVLISYSENNTEALAIYLPFTIKGHVASGSFLLLFDKVGFERMTQLLQVPGALPETETHAS